MEKENICGLMNEDDLVSMKQILPYGLKVSPNCLKIDGKYTTCLIASVFPSKIPDLRLLDLQREDVIVTFDIEKADKGEVISDVAKSLNEVESREAVTRRTADFLENSYEYTDLLDLHGALLRENEEILLVTIRIYVTSTSMKDLKSLVETIKNEIYNKIGLRLIETNYELSGSFEALATTANTVGQQIPLYDTFARQYPFSFQSHADRTGFYLGHTPSGGVVLLDTFLVSGSRTSFDMLLIGTKGAGKSALLKSMCQDHLAKGGRCTAIDVEGEMQQLVKLCGGTYISGLGGKSNLNPLEIGIVTDSEDAESEEEYLRSNFTAELERIITFFTILFSDLDSQAESYLKIALELSYRKFEISPETDVSVLSSEDFPVMKDLYLSLAAMLYGERYSIDSEGRASGTIKEGINARQSDILESLLDRIYPIACGAYESMFGRKSSVKISSENFVVFDVSNLIQFDTASSKAQMFMLLTYLWQDVLKNRQRNRENTERTYSVCMIDEAHRFFNNENPRVINFINRMVRQARKYDAGLWFASQSIQDFFPSSDTELKDKVLSVFANIQYKIIMKQDGSQIPLLKKAFPQFNVSDLHKTPAFTAGDMLISLGGRESYICSRYIPKGDLAIFGGGREK